MKNHSKRKGIVAIILSMILCTSCMVGCGVSESVTKKASTSEKANVINMNLDESKMLAEPYGTTFSSKDSNIAYTNEEGHVIALNEGTTTITAKSKEGEHTYQIKVTDNRTQDDKAFDNFTEVTDQAASIGYGYNVLKSGDVSANGVLYTSPIFDEDEVVGTGKLRMTKQNDVKTSSITGDNMAEYSDNLSTDMKVGGEASYGKYFSMGVDTDFSKMAKGKKATKERFNKMYVNAQTMTISLAVDPSKYMGLLSEGFKKALTDSSISPKDLFKRYGTHVIVSGIYGGKLDFNYYLYSTKSDATTSQIDSVAANVHASFNKFDAKANFKYDKSYETTASQNNVHVAVTTRVVGGDLFDMKSEEGIASNYKDWLGSIKDKPAFIGAVNAGSLCPIWEILPLTDEYKERRNELEEYFRDTAEENYDSLLDDYGNTVKSADKMSFGSFPQERADEDTAQALAGGKGKKTGTFVTSGDILTYKGKKYLAYTPSQSTNGYDSGKTYYFEFSDLKWEYYGTDKNNQKLYVCTSIIDASNTGNACWKDSKIRTFLNGKFYNTTFSSIQKKRLGNVRYYMHNVGGKGNSVTVGDRVSIAPSKGEYKNDVYPITDYAYAKGVNTSISFWAAHSNFIDPAYCRLCKLYGGDHSGSWALAYVNDHGKWFETYASDMNQGVKPTIAIKK